MRSTYIFFVFLFVSKLCFGQNYSYKAFYFIDSSKSLSANEIIKNDSFLFKKERTNLFFNVRKNDNAHWIKFRISNHDSLRQKFFLYEGNPFIDIYDGYVVAKNKIIKEVTFRYNGNIRKGFGEKFPNLVFDFEVSPLEVIDVYLKIQSKGNRLSSFELILFDQDRFLETGFIRERVYSFFLGLLMAIALISFAFWWSSKSAIYLYYAIYTFLMSIAFLGISGYLAAYIEMQSDALSGINSFHFYGVLALVFNALFLSKLFNLKDKTSFYSIYMRFLIPVCLFTAIMILLFDFYFSKEIFERFRNQINFYVLFLINIIVTLAFFIKKKKAVSMLYLFSFLPLFILLAVRLLSSYGFMDKPLKLSWFVLPAISFEFLVLFIGLCKMFVNKLQEKNTLELRLKTIQIETQDAERKQIAADLHDDLGSTFALIKDRVFKETNNLETHELILKAIEDLRSVSRNLLPADFELFGFIPSIEKYISGLNKNGNLMMTMIVFGDRVKLKTTTELNIYRVLIELMHNVKKHSKAKTATIQLIYHIDYLHVSLEEDSLGRDLLVKSLSGVGQKTIISRLNFINASILEHGIDSHGYAYMFEVPYLGNI